MVDSMVQRWLKYVYCLKYNMPFSRPCFSYHFTCWNNRISGDIPARELNEQVYSISIINSSKTLAYDHESRKFHILMQMTRNILSYIPTHPLFSKLAMAYNLVARFLKGSFPPYIAAPSAEILSFIHLFIVPNFTNLTHTRICLQHW